MICYRRAETKDIDDLVLMRLQFIKEVQHVEDSDKDDVLEEELMKFFNAMMPDDGFIAWVADENGKIISTSGLCFYTLAPSYKNMSGKVAYIQNMYTLPEYRGRGIAKVLFDKVLTEAKKLGYKKISLHATEMGRLIYEKFGFNNVENEMILNM
jgi:GNAT superfamily N-acetyltransferase